MFPWVCLINVLLRVEPRTPAGSDPELGLSSPAVFSLGCPHTLTHWQVSFCGCSGQKHSSSPSSSCLHGRRHSSLWLGPALRTGQERKRKTRTIPFCSPPGRQMGSLWSSHRPCHCWAVQGHERNNTNQENTSPVGSSCRFHCSPHPGSYAVSSGKGRFALFHLRTRNQKKYVYKT